MSSDSPYISRQSAENLDNVFAKALKNPAENPIVFHIWGIGGVGKSTLTKKLKENHLQNANFAEVSFGVISNIETPLKVMEKLYNQLSDKSILERDIKSLSKSNSFLPLYQEYKDTLHQLEITPIEGQKSVEKEQLDIVKKISGQGFNFLAQLAPASGITAPVAQKCGEYTVEVASILLTEKDRIVNLLSQHRATKNKRNLQELMLNPLPKLTKAFIEGLKEKKVRLF